MVLVSVAAAVAKKDRAPMEVIPGVASLVLVGTVLYLRRSREEKRLKVDGQQ